MQHRRLHRQSLKPRLKGRCIMYEWPRNLINEIGAEYLGNLINEKYDIKTVEIGAHTTAMISEVMTTLKEREEECIYAHFRDGKTYSECGKMLGDLSAERARQIVVKGIRKLKNPARAKKIAISLGDITTRMLKLVEREEKHLEEHKEMKARIEYLESAVAVLMKCVEGAPAKLHAEGINDSIEILDMNIRAFNVLWRAGIMNCSDLVNELKTNPANIYNLRNMGDKSYKELVECVNQYFGLDLPTTMHEILERMKNNEKNN